MERARTRSRSESSGSRVRRAPAGAGARVLQTKGEEGCTDLYFEEFLDVNGGEGGQRCLHKYHKHHGERWYGHRAFSGGNTEAGLRGGVEGEGVLPAAYDEEKKAEALPLRQTA